MKHSRRCKSRKGGRRNVAAEGLIEDIDQHAEEVKDDRMLDTLLLAGIKKSNIIASQLWLLPVQWAVSLVRKMSPEPRMKY